MDDNRIIKHVSIISCEAEWQKELNVVSVNGGSFVYDIREWSVDHSEYRNGLSLSTEEAQKLLVNLGECFKVDVSDIGTIQITMPVVTGEEPKSEKTSSGDDLYAFLKSNNINFIDKRSLGGALWIVGGHELDEVMNQCRKMGFKFFYTEKGGRLTGYKPGWYLHA